MSVSLRAFPHTKERVPEISRSPGDGRKPREAPRGSRGEARLPTLQVRQQLLQVHSYGVPDATHAEDRSSGGPRRVLVPDWIHPTSPWNGSTQSSEGHPALLIRLPADQYRVARGLLPRLPQGAGGPRCVLQADSEPASPIWQAVLTRPGMSPLHPPGMSANSPRGGEVNVRAPHRPPVAN